MSLNLWEDEVGYSAKAALFWKMRIHPAILFQPISKAQALEP